MGAIAANIGIDPDDALNDVFRSLQALEGYRIRYNP